jgi:hypothetical protein
LLLAGTGSLVYGWFFHAAPVAVEKERQISIAVPSLPGLEGPSQEGPPADDGSPFRTPPNIPGIKFEKMTEKYVETSEKPEWALVREVTFGGVVRLANGQLKQTYSGKPPALCPS